MDDKKKKKKIRTKSKEDPSTDDGPLMESLPEESFLRKRKISENVDRRNNTSRGKSVSQVLPLPCITEEFPDIENRIDTILNRHPLGAVKEEEPFFPK